MSLKVLYISHHRQASGWGQAARDYILAMQSVGIDVVIRSVNLNGLQIQLPSQLEKLEQKSAIGCNICIQHLLPHHLSKENFKRNIGLIALETTKYNFTSWPLYMNLMDEIWFPCYTLQMDAQSNGITVPTRTVQHACNFDKYNKIENISIPTTNGKYVFYTIGELHHRKNIEALLTAFHSEFDTSEPVMLLLKLTKPQLAPQALHNMITETIKTIKAELRRYTNVQMYKQELVISDYVTAEQILGIHTLGDCFVLPSRGEAWSIPLFDALAMGNIGISTDCGGPCEYLYPDLLVSSYPNVCSGVLDTFPGISTCQEQWREIVIPELMTKMREVYTYDTTDIEELAKYHTKKLQQFSYENIGNKIKEILNEFSA